MFRTVRQVISAHYKYRHQILHLAKVDKDKSFRGSDLGWVWALFRPAIRIMVYYVAMSIGFKASKNVPGVHCNYFLWLVTGLVPWFYISSMISGGASCFRKYKGIIQKTKFPVSTIPTIVMISNFRIHLIVFSCTLLMFPLMGTMPNIYWLQIPFYMLLMLIFTYLWSLTTGLLSAVSADFLNVLKTINAAVLWLSGILFDMSTIENKAAVIFLKLNPVAFIVEGYRNCLCKNIWFFEDYVNLLYFLGVTLVLFVISMKLYAGLRKKLPEIL